MTALPWTAIVAESAEDTRGPGQESAKELDIGAIYAIKCG
jgi:hypothetical protein